jgi:tetratricopeptide (TPR) repeat protein
MELFSMNKHILRFTAIRYSSKIFSVFILLFLFVGCGEKPERHLDLGLWYYQKGLVDDAVLEFKEVIRLLPADPRRMTSNELDIVAQAHYNLAIAYSKKQWFELALAEAGLAFDLRPTPENYRLQELVRRRKDLEPLRPDSAVRPG